MYRPRALRVVLIATAAVMFLNAGPTMAGEWASWRGPQANGVAAESDLIESWSRGGENLIWRQDFSGRSTPVVFDGRACAIGRAGEGIERQETVACWDAGTGEKRWERRFVVHNTSVPWNRVGWASVEGDPETGYLFAHTVDGGLICLDRDGEIVWHWRLGEDVGRMSGYGGRTFTPIVDGDLLLLSVIGANWGLKPPVKHAFYAFDKRNGDIVWVSVPGKAGIEDANAYSIPVVAEIDGQRLLIGGGADGWIHAVKVGTGEPVWSFELSQRAINSSVVVEGNTVFASHSEENVDSGVMGRLVAIDATGQGNVTKSHELWRAEEVLAGYASPLIHDGKLYVVDNSANLHVYDAKSGALKWSHNFGTVGKGSPVWADGKLYLTETNGNVVILRPGAEGAETLDEEHLEMPNGRYAEIYASAAVAYGRIYFTTEEGVYCLGDKSKPFTVTHSPAPSEPAAGEGPPTWMQVVPAEVVAMWDAPQDFTARLFDSKGRLLREVDAAWTLEGLAGAIDGDGKATFEPKAGPHTGFVHAKADGLEGTARVRVAGPLPWSEDFESLPEGAFPDGWLGRGKGAHVRAVEGGGKILVQPRAKKNAPRATLYLGPDSMSGYTIQADVYATQEGRRRPDIGVVNSGYTLDLQGNHQRLMVRSWEAERRMAQQQDFAWDMETWYTIKLRVDYERGADGAEKAVVRGKVWKRGEAEPTAWSMTVEDPLPIKHGSPGLYAFSPVEAHFDNVKVMVSE